MTAPSLPRSEKRYEGLKAWHACHDLALAVHRAARAWPVSEARYLSDQARRASFGAAANMVEGTARRGPREFRRFLDMSLGSLAELAYILRLARDLGWLTPARYGELEALRDHAGQLTWGLYRAVTKNAARGGPARARKT